MNELIAIGTSKGGKRTVNAKELHQFLEVGKDFNTWIKGRIDKYDFIEGTDFIRIRTTPQNGGVAIDYHITLDMAKELSMVERNEKGKQARQYFIECERRLKESAPTPALPSYTEALRQLADKIEANERLQLELKQAAPKVEFANAISDTDDCILIGELAKILTQNGVKRIGQNTLFAWLRGNGFLIKKAGSSYNLPTQAAMNEGYFRIIERPIIGPNGPEIAKTTKVTVKGQKFFINLFMQFV